MDTHSATDEDDRCVIIWTEDDLGQSDLQFTICSNLVALFIDLFAAWNVTNKVGANLQFRYRQGEAKAQVTPDVYVLPGEPQADRDLSSWATWERGGKAPSLAIEVVSRDSRKDYTRDPSGMLARYQDLGVKELVRYDPLWSPGSRSRRLLTHWVRSAAGELVEQEQPQLNMVRLSTVGVLLLHVGPAKGWLRLAQLAPDGLCLWPTRAERLEAERQRAAAEAERATAEAERADQAEAQLAALRAELAALREGRSS